MSATLKRITSADGILFKRVRLRALQESPTAFGSTYAEESTLADEVWTERAARCGEENRIGFLILDGENPCGIVRGTPDEDDFSVGWVQSMWVDPAFRKQGFGRGLIDEIIRWGQSRGMRGLKLWVTETNRPAIGLYRSCGFQPTGRTEPYANDAALVECEMLLELPGSAKGSSSSPPRQP